MSNVRFVLGAEADIASTDDVRSAVREGVDGIIGRLPSRHNAYRRRIPQSVNINPASTGAWVLDFGSPSPGYAWWIVEVVVGAATATVSNADREAPASAVATLYIGTPPRQQGNPPSVLAEPAILGNLVRPAAAIPAVFSFPKEAYPVHDGENLFVQVYSGTTAIVVTMAVATVMEIPDAAVMIRST